MIILVTVFDIVAIPSSSRLQGREYPFISVSGCRSACSGAALGPAWSPGIPRLRLSTVHLSVHERARAATAVRSAQAAGTEHGWEHANTGDQSLGVWDSI